MVNKMAMLAEPRRKQKFSINPRGSDWSNDESKFGQKLMEKMGWAKGKGLGANENGSTEHVSVTLKSDKKGVGCSNNHADKWIAHQDDFNALLANLNQDHGNGGNSSDDNSNSKVLNLEQKSRTTKGRVHYQKFTKGKDLSLKSEMDLDCVFGKRKSASNTPLTQSEANSDVSDAEEKSTGFNTVTSTDSIQEYFARKMAEKKLKLQNGGGEYGRSNEDLESLSNAVEDTTGNEEILVENNDDKSEQLQSEGKEKKKKSKKGKKRKLEEKIENCEIMEINDAVEDEESPRKKKKKRKSEKEELVDCIERSENSKKRVSFMIGDDMDSDERDDEKKEAKQTKSKKSKKQKKSRSDIDRKDSDVNELNSVAITINEELPEKSESKKSKKQQKNNDIDEKTDTKCGNESKNKNKHTDGEVEDGLVKEYEKEAKKSKKRKKSKKDSKVDIVESNATEAEKTMVKGETDYVEDSTIKVSKNKPADNPYGSRLHSFPLIQKNSSAFTGANIGKVKGYKGLSDIYVRAQLEKKNKL